MSAPRPPRSRPASATVAMVVALLLIALAVVGVHDLATHQGWTSGSDWLRPVASDLDGRRPTTLVVVIGVLVALVGLWLVLIALKPARRTHEATPMDAGDVWISRRAIARLATQAAERSPAVESATTQVTRSKVKVAATLSAADAGVVETVRDNVERAVQGFAALSVRVSTKAVHDDA